MSYYEVKINLPAGASIQCGHQHATPGGAEKCLAGIMRTINPKDHYGAYIVDNTGAVYLPPPVPLSPLVRRAAEAVADGKSSGIESDWLSARERTGYGHYPIELCKDMAELREQGMAREYEEDQEYGGYGTPKFMKD